MRSQDMRAHISGLRRMGLWLRIYNRLTGYHERNQVVLDPLEIRLLPVYIKRNCSLKSICSRFTHQRPEVFWLTVHIFDSQSAFETSEEVEKHALVVWVHGKTFENPVGSWEARKSWKCAWKSPWKVRYHWMLCCEIKSTWFFWNIEISGILAVKANANSTQSKAKTRKIEKNNIPGGCLPGMWLCIEACHGFREKG